MVFRWFNFSEFEWIPSFFNSANLLKFRLCFCSAEWKSGVFLRSVLFSVFRIFVKFRTAIRSAFEWAIPLLFFIPRLSGGSAKFWNLARQFFWTIYLKILKKNPKIKPGFFQLRKLAPALNPTLAYKFQLRKIGTIFRWKLKDRKLQWISVGNSAAIEFIHC